MKCGCHGKEIVNLRVRILHCKKKKYEHAHRKEVKMMEITGESSSVCKIENTQWETQKLIQQEHSEWSRTWHWCTCGEHSACRMVSIPPGPLKRTEVDRFLYSIMVIIESKEPHIFCNVGSEVIIIWILRHRSDRFLCRVHVLNSKYKGEAMKPRTLEDPVMERLNCRGM